jgi:hypothetical protein
MYLEVSLCILQDDVPQERQTHNTFCLVAERRAKNTSSLSSEAKICSSQLPRSYPPAKSATYIYSSAAAMVIHVSEGLSRTSFFFLLRRAVNLSIFFFTEQIPPLSAPQNSQTNVPHFPTALPEHLVQPSTLSRRQSKFSPNLKPSWLWSRCVCEWIVLLEFVPIQEDMQVL